MKKNKKIFSYLGTVLGALVCVAMLLNMAVEVRGEVSDASTFIAPDSSSPNNISLNENSIYDNTSDMQEAFSTSASSQNNSQESSSVSSGENSDLNSSNSFDDTDQPTSSSPTSSTSSSNSLSENDGSESSSSQIMAEAETEFEEINPLLDETSYISVSSFNQLKTILESTSQNKKIVLTEDITGLSGGITVHSSWTEVVIDGKDPVTGINHTYKEYNSANAGDTINIRNNTTKSFTFQNLTIDGKNYYGSICVYDGYLDVTLTYNSVKYVGPQITYNKSGTAKYIDCDVSIEKNGGPSGAEEVGEVLYVEMGGTTSIKSTTTSRAVFWLTNSNGTIKILKDANVTVTTSYYFAYEAGVNTSLTVEDGASFVYTGNYGLTYSTSGYFGTVSVGENATLSATQKETTSSDPLINILATLEVKNNGSLYFYQSNSSSAIRFVGSNPTFSLSSPKKVMVAAPNGTVTSLNGVFTLNATVGAINIWNSLPNGITNTLDDLPTNIWNQQDGSDFSLTALLAGANTGSLTTTWSGEATQWNQMLTKDTFKLAPAKLFVMGSYSLDVPQPIYTNTSLLKGQANSQAQVGAYYNSTKSTGTANADGSFSLPVDFSTLQVGDKIGVLSNHDQIKAYRFYKISEGELKFLSVPSVMAFQGGTIPDKPTYIYREDANWNIEVEDTRGVNSTWRLDASVPNKIQDSSNNVLEGNLKLVSGSQLIPLGTTPATIYNATTGTNSITSVGWQADQGILLWIDTISSIRPNVAYTTTINWDLIDAP